MKTVDRAAAACRGKSFRRAALIGVAGLSLTACAGVTPEFSVSEAPAALPEPPPAPPQPQPKPKPPTALARTSPKARAGDHGQGVGRYKVGSPYRVAGVLYVPAYRPDYDEVGIASWYGDEFNGRPTANGERFDMYSASAAHTTLPLPSIVEVTNLDNGRSIRVRLNDRGPFKSGRIIDLSRAAARDLGYMNRGLARVRVRYVGPARLDGSLEPLYVARATPAAKAALRLAAMSAKDPPPVVQAVWRSKRAAGAATSMSLAQNFAAKPMGALPPLW